MKENTTIRTEFIHMRVTKELKKVIQKMAREDSRSVSMEMEYLIKEEYERRNK